MEVCKDYLVVLPAGPRFEDPELYKEVLSALVARFPNYTWKIHHGHRSKSGTFVVLPSLKTVPPPGEVAAKMEVQALMDFHEFLESSFVDPTKRVN